MKIRFLFLALAVLLAFENAYSINNEEIYENLISQVIQYNPAYVNSFYYKKIPNSEFLEFLEIYKDRPIEANYGGIRSHGSFFLWYFLKNINPSLVIESGVWHGHSTWMIEKAVQHAKIISIDPILEPIMYRSKKATYTTQDFSNLTIDSSEEGPIVAFFDDHINAYERTLQAHAKGIKHLIFDDNYPAFNCEHSASHLTLSDCFELEEHKEKATMLKKIIKHYYIMPQILGKRMSVGNIVINNLPAIWEKLEDIKDYLFQSKMKIFYDDSECYQFITYVELY